MVLTGDTLVQHGERRLDWIRSRMRLLAAIKEEFARSRPFRGLRIGVAIHLDPKTAVLLEVLAAGGAEIVATGNHGSTQDDIVAVLRSQGMTIHGARDDTAEQHAENLTHVLASQPDIILDNGGDLIAQGVRDGTTARIVGATEETTSGGDRLRGELAGRVPYPVIVINDSPLKQIGENKHAVGQSVVESFMRITNLMVPGRRFVVIGYGWCGRGVAQYLRALGGRVAVVERDELKAFEAAMDGFRVGATSDLAGWGEVFITATGRPNVLGPEDFARMESGAVLANCGHFAWEIDVSALTAHAERVREVDDGIEQVEFADGRYLTLIAGGRMLNLAGREPKGNSLESMDLGFLLQAMSLERVARRPAELTAGAHPVPDDLNREIARRMLAAMQADR